MRLIIIFISSRWIVNDVRFKFIEMSTIMIKLFRATVHSLSMYSLCMVLDGASCDVHVTPSSSLIRLPCMDSTILVSHQGMLLKNF